MDLQYCSRNKAARQQYFPFTGFRLATCLSVYLPPCTYLSVCGCVSIAVLWLVMRLRDATYLLIYTLIKLATSKRGRDCTGDDE